MAKEQRLIDANALLENIQYRLPVNDMVAQLINDIVDITRTQIVNAPTVDAVPVVRCKDCKHYHAEQGWCDEHSSFIDERGVKCHPWESNDWRMFEEDDFCSYGERRTDNG